MEPPAELAPPASPRLSGVSASDVVKTKVESFFAGKNSRRIHIQTDKPLYKPGETIWVRIWDVTTKGLSGQHPTAGMHVELLSPRGAQVAKRKVREQSGAGQTDFALDASIVGGEYKLKVKTFDGVQEGVALINYLLAKREVRDWPGIGAALEALGALFVDRDDAQSGARVIREAVTRLRSDVSVLTFAEGTTTSGRGVLPFRRGIFGAARIARVPVVPVAIRYEDPELSWVGSQSFLPHYLRTASKAVTHVHLHFMDPLEVAEGGEDRCAKHARQMVRAWVAPHAQA